MNDLRNYAPFTQYMAKMMDVRFKRGLEYADHLMQFMGSQHGSVLPTDQCLAVSALSH